MDGPLDNPRHERFANAIASGATPTKAYILAGYRESGAAASANRLLKDAKICSRVAYLQKLASGTAIAKVAIDREWVLHGLKTVAERCLDESNFQPTGANRAFELLGKELGMFREQSDHKFTFDGDLSKLTESQLQKLMLSLEARIADPVLLQQAREEAVKELDAGETVN